MLRVLTERQEVENSFKINYKVGGETHLKEACGVLKQCLMFCLCEES